MNININNIYIYINTNKQGGRLYPLMNPHYAAVSHVKLVVAELCCGTPCQLPAERRELSRWKRPNARAQALKSVFCFLVAICVDLGLGNYVFWFVDFKIKVGC